MIWIIAMIMLILLNEIQKTATEGLVSNTRKSRIGSKSYVKKDVHLCLRLLKIKLNRGT